MLDNLLVVKIGECFIETSCVFFPLAVLGAAQDT